MFRKHLYALLIIAATTCTAWAAISHIAINSSSPQGGELRTALKDFYRALDIIQNKRAAMNQMYEDPDYSYLAEQFGLPEAKAETAINELNSAFGKLSTNSQVDSVHAALVQVRTLFE